MNTLTTENNLIANFIELLNKEECYITSKPQKNQEEYIHAIRTLRKFANVDIGSEKAAKRKRVFQPGDTPISYEQAQENLEKARKNAGMSYAIVLGNMAEFFKKNPNACKRVEA